MTTLQSAGGRVGKRKTSEEVDDENDQQASQSTEGSIGKTKGAHTGEEGNENEDCVECKLPLARSSHLINIVDFPGRWHAECFRCALCREPMDKQQSCHTYRNQVICRDDYLRLKRDKAVHCARCRWPISASDWVRKAATHVYHIACFNCDICLRQLNTGEQFIISDLQRPVTPQVDKPDIACEKVRLLCRLHFNVDAPKTSDFSNDNKVRKEFHLKINDLGLGSPKAMNDEQMLQSKRLDDFDEHHRAGQYSQLVALPCGARNPISPGSPAPTPNQAVHLSDCSAISSMLTRQPTSPHEYGQQASDDQHLIPVTAAATTSGAINLSSSSSSSVASSSSSMHTNYLSPMTPTNSSQTSGSGLPCKSKRVRTTFTEDQLSILQTHFHIDSNPDGQDLERIATITGLSKRVTQVWFQNSRARQKKYMIKRKPLSGAATLALAASFGIAPSGMSGGGSPTGGQQQTSSNFRLGPFANSASDETVFNSNREQRLDLIAPSWRQADGQSVSGQPLPEGDKTGEHSFNGNQQHHDEQSNTSDDDQASMIMDEDSQQSGSN